MAPWCQISTGSTEASSRCGPGPGANPGALSDIQRETIDAVLGYYGDKPSQWLSDLTHREDPWLEARRGLAPGERGCREISHAAMAEYYGSLT